MLAIVAGAGICLNVSIRTCCIEKKVRKKVGKKARKGVSNSPEKVIVEKASKNDINESKDTNQKNQKRRDEKKFETQTFPTSRKSSQSLSGQSSDQEQMQNHFLLKRQRKENRIQYH